MTGHAEISTHGAEHIFALILLQLAVILPAARLLHVLARRLRQPGVIGEIIAGIVLGPSMLGAWFPEVFHTLFAPATMLPMSIISQLGLLLLMFQIGSDFRLDALSDERNRRAVLAIASVSIVVPLVAGGVIGWLSAAALAPGKNPAVYSLFVGTALAITAVPVLGRIMRDFNLARTEVGAVAMGAAATNDVAGWTLLAAISAFATARFSIGQTGLQLGGIALLLAVALYAGRPFVHALVKRLQGPADDTLSPAMMMTILALIFCVGLATASLGIFAAFGGFLVGMLFHREQHVVAAWERQVGRFVDALFLPIFFTFTGLRTDIAGLTSGSDWAWLIALTACAIGAKIVPVYVAARRSGLGPETSRTLGVMMNTRGLMELVVLNVGRDLGVIPTNVFSMLVIVAVVTTLMTAPLLNRTLLRSGNGVFARTDA